MWMFMPVLASALLDPPLYRSAVLQTLARSSTVFPACSDGSNPL
jgi:hypothetical protein